MSSSLLKHQNNHTMNSLEQQIRKYNEAYRIGEPLISDAEYDAMVEELKRTDPNNAWFKSIEPSHVSNTRKVSLPIPMKSLNKVKTISDLKKWCFNTGLTEISNIVCMPKFDGISLLHDEQSGMTYSRGGAENEGQNCTSHFNMTYASLLHPNSGLHYTFGEFVFSREKWQQLKNDSEKNGVVLKSPRNTAAGLINRDEPCADLKYVSFFRYGTDDKSLKKFTTFSMVIDHICEQYDQQPLYEIMTVDSLTEDLLMSLFKTWSLKYPIDGIVIYANNLSVWRKMGRDKTTGNPLYAIAYKHPDFTDVFETTVKDISWKVSKSGALKPVVNIESVDTGDCNMENPTGYNAKWILNNHIASGAKILVTRSGGVIPKILETVSYPNWTETNNLLSKLQTCPHCQSRTEWNDTHVELCCTNPNCSGIQLAKIVFFYNTLGAENIGEETISKIFEAGFNSINLMLKIRFQDIIQIEGMGDVTANIILKNNKKILEGVDLPTLMQASDCFKGIGTIKANKILEAMTEDEVEKFASGHYIFKCTPEDKAFNKLPITTKNLTVGYPKFVEFLNETGIPVMLPVKHSVVEGGKCFGHVVCVSGFRSNDFERFIVDNGGRIVSGVSKNTTHLIVKDKTSLSGKISKAKSLSIPIMDMDEYYKNLNN